MTEDRRPRRGGFFLWFAAAVLTPRFLVPVVASSALTALVAGPLALQALAARDDAPADEIAVEEPVATTTTTTTTTATATATTLPATPTTTTTTLPPATTTTTSATLPPATTTTTSATLPPTTTTTTTTSTVPPTTTTIAPDPVITLTTVGALEAGRSGVIAIDIDPRGVSGPLTIPVSASGATILDVTGDGWACTGTPVTCSGSTDGTPITLFVRLSVDGGASAVDLSAGGADLQVATASTAELSARFATAGAVTADVVGNSQMTCGAGQSTGGFTCAEALAGIATGQAATNNAWAMEWTSTDARPAAAERNSTSADLPALDAVTFAGLHWGGRAPGASAGSHGDVMVALTDGSVPTSDADYTVVSAEEFVTASNSFQGFADVTAWLQGQDPASMTNPTMWVADITASTGTNAFAGWSLTIVHPESGSDQTVIVLDGFRDVRSSTPAEVTIVGGPEATSASLTVVAYETDAGLGPDGVQIDDVDVTSGFEVFDSIRTGSFPSRAPEAVNALGHDIDMLDVTGLIGGSVPEARLRFETAGDTYIVGVAVVVTS